MKGSKTLLVVIASIYFIIDKNEHAEANVKNSHTIDNYKFIISQQISFFFLILSI